jgi:predicted transcriptional regulator
MDVEHVFKALADHHRRHLLDLLFQQDGQTLTKLSAQLPMTRFGVMKHLHVLEEAGLISTRKVGREKLHYLNRDMATRVELYRRFWEESLDRFEEHVLKLQQQEKNEGEDNEHYNQQI